MIRVLVVGGSRGLGLEAVKAALKKGHEVSAFSRKPEKLDMQHPNLKLLAGNVLDSKSLDEAVKGHDVVICTLGIPTLNAIGPPLAKRSYVLSKGTENILKAMEHQNIKRFICVTAIGTGESKDQCSLLARIVLRGGLRWLFIQKDAQERLIKNSHNVNWTIVRPTALTKGKLRGAKVFKHIRCGLLTNVSRADIAYKMTEIIDQENVYKKALTISYPPRFGDSLRWTAGFFGIG